MKTVLILCFTVCLAVITAAAQNEKIAIPAEVEPFVENGAVPIAVESADLNGDGLKDYVLVIHRENVSERDKHNYPKNQRPLLILVRGSNNKLTEAKRNVEIVYCSECGGVMGDPFAGVTVGKNTFTVNHYGGSAWRWELVYKFDYSRIDKTWQLVRFERHDFHAADSKTLTKKVKLPKDFGKIDISEFSPSLFNEDSSDLQRLSEAEIKDLLPGGFRAIHPVVSGDFGGWNSGGANEPESDSRNKFVLLYSDKNPADTYRGKVVVPAGFEAFDVFDLPDPLNIWSIMEPIAVFFENVDKDADKELLILERCMTGVGPKGAEFFYRTRVYDWKESGFIHLDKLSELIGNGDTVAKIRLRLATLKR